MIRFWERAKSIAFILNQTTRSLKDRTSLLKSVLGTAEFFFSAVDVLLQGKEGDDLAEVKSLLLQVDQALGFSQCLLMGTLANSNCTLTLRG
jgi:hypothetical protein